MADILNDPVKIVMLIILVALEIPAAILLTVWWRKACTEAEKHKHFPDGDANKI